MTTTPPPHHVDPEQGRDRKETAAADGGDAAVRVEQQQQQQEESLATTRPVPPLIARYYDLDKIRYRKGWIPSEAYFPDDNTEETYPFLESIVTMRKIKSYTNGENLVPTTTYSFIVSTQLGRATNLVNLSVFLLQTCSYVAVVTSVIDFDSAHNPFQFPPNVEASVRATQFLSMIYSICVQKGMIAALYTIRNGYNETELRRSFPNCAKHPMNLKIRWYIAMSLILGLGLVAQFLTFILIMQATDVLGVLLNYAAVSFISTIDDQMFYLGKRGWLGDEVEKQVRLVCLADEPDPGPKWHRRLAHTTAGALIFASLIAMWIAVVIRQTNGAYLPSSIFVEFSDDVNPTFGVFSGPYDVKLDAAGIFSSKRAVYTDRRSKQAHFGYCNEIDAWTFNYNVTQDEFDACEWFARSTETRTYDVVTTAVSQWRGQDRTGRAIPLQRTEITSFVCSKTPKFCGQHGTCNRNTNECVCNPGWFGAQCSFRDPCPIIQLDARLLSSFGTADRTWSSSYEKLVFGNRTYIVYGKPVYVTLTNPPGQVAAGKVSTFDVIYFTGRRWAMAYSPFLKFYKKNDGEDLESYLAKFPLHGEFTEGIATFLSEPTTPINENPAPIGLEWFYADQKFGQTSQEATTSSLGASFMCAVCDNITNPCFYNGVCRPEGRCKCAEGSDGSLCEAPPISNGRCDPYFNELPFGMDGGDCCRATCESSLMYRCGKDSTGFLDTGFFFCKSSESLQSGEITGEPLTETGKFVRISQNGILMAVATKNSDIAIYDKSGGFWLQRTVLNVCGRSSVRAIDMTGGPFVPNPFVKETPFVLVASCVGQPLPVVYFCKGSSECIVERITQPPEADDSFGSLVAVSSDGSVVAATSEGAVGFARAERSNRGSVVWTPQVNETLLPVRFGLLDGWFGNVGEEEGVFGNIVSMSLAGNGNALALVLTEGKRNSTAIVAYYQFNGRKWEAKGAPIELNLCPSPFGWNETTFLSKNGMTMMVSDGSQVSIFNWVEANNTWSQEEKLVEGANCTIQALTLAESGKDVAVSTITRNSDEVRTEVLSFGRRDGSTWKRRETSTRNEAREVRLRLHLSGDGRELAMSAPYYQADRAGLVRTREYPRSECDEGFMSYRLTMTVRSNITRWSYTSLKTDNTFSFSGGGPYLFPNFPGADGVSVARHDGATVVEEVCVPITSCGLFKVHPTSFGGIAVLQNGTTILERPQVDDAYTALGGELPESECQSVEFPPVPPQFGFA